MRKVIMALDKDSLTRFNLYADVITLSTENYVFRTTERACEELQNALLTIERLLAFTCMKESSEKNFLLAHWRIDHSTCKVFLGVARPTPHTAG